MERIDLALLSIVWSIGQCSVFHWTAAELHKIPSMGITQIIIDLEFNVMNISSVKAKVTVIQA